MKGRDSVVGKTCVRCGVYTVCGVHPINGCFYGEPRAPTQKEGEEMRKRIAELEALLLTAVEKLEHHDEPKAHDPYPACGIMFPKLTDEINAALRRGR